MRPALSRYLLDVYRLLRDEHRERGLRPGPALERDLEGLAQSRWLHTERRARRGPFGGAYYSGLAPETDLFVYDGPQFLHVEAKDLDNDPVLAGKLALPGYKARPERALLLHLKAFDWNCPQHITRRFSEAELEPALAPVRLRLDRLEAENGALRQKLASLKGS